MRDEELLNRGFIVVYVQSSQVTRHKGYSWQRVVHNNPDKKNWPSLDRIHKISEKSYTIRECYESAYDEIKSCYDHVKSKYFIDEDRVIIGGFSGGK